MAKVDIQYSDKALSASLKGIHEPLSFVLKEELKFLKSHSKLLQWVEWGGKPKSLGLYLCNDREIRSYNRDYRKMDKATDVLSFPSFEAANALEAQGVLDGYLGDMIISIETVERAAKKHGRSFFEELVEVFIHGVLHLLGFDHLQGARGVTRKDAAEMKSLQRELFCLLRGPIKKRYERFVKKP